MEIIISANKVVLSLASIENIDINDTMTRDEFFEWMKEAEEILTTDDEWFQEI